MKLRNKKTGEIIDIYKGEITLHYNQGRKTIHFKRLEDLEEWEDYEEPEEDFWYIDSNCETYGVSRAFNQNDSNDVLFNKSIGNYFETKEEAELAVRKLKAWKRLKDYNVMFTLDFVKNKIDFTYSINNSLLDVIDGEEQIFNNMKIVFGGEE